MADVLLVNPSVIRRPAPDLLHPPHELLRLAAVLRQAGYAVEVRDAAFGGGPLLGRGLPRAAAVYAAAEGRAEALGAIAALKEHGIRVVAYGADPSRHDGDYLRDGADVVVRGDADAAILEILDAFGLGGAGARPSDARLAAIPGVSFLDEDVIHRRADDAPRPCAGCPAPAYDLVDLDRYLAAQRRLAGRATLPLALSRGPTCAAEELADLARRHGVDHLRLEGEPDRSFLEAFAAALPRPLATFEVRARAADLDAPLIARLHEKGLAKVTVALAPGAAAIAAECHRRGVSLALEVALDCGASIEEVLALAPVDVAITSGSRTARALLRASYAHEIEPTARTRAALLLARWAHAAVRSASAVAAPVLRGALE